MLLPPDLPSGAGAPKTEQQSPGVSGHTDSSPVEVHSCPRKYPSRRSRGCPYRKCRCRCHTEGSTGGRFWGFQYTPLSMILADCDNPRCDTRQYKVSFRVALSQFGLNWAVTASAVMQSGGGSYPLGVSLRPQHIVRFTSDGFLLLFNILQGLTSLDDGIASFKTLCKNDPSLVDHVNPAGRGYIEVRWPGSRSAGSGTNNIISGTTHATFTFSKPWGAGGAPTPFYKRLWHE